MTHQWCHWWFPTTSCFGVTNHSEAASLWLVRQDRATINWGSPPSCGATFWQLSVASPSEMGWLANKVSRYLSIPCLVVTTISLVCACICWRLPSVWLCFMNAFLHFFLHFVHSFYSHWDLLHAFSSFQPYRLMYHLSFHQLHIYTTKQIFILLLSSYFFLKHDLWTCPLIDYILWTEHVLLSIQRELMVARLAAVGSGGMNNWCRCIEHRTATKERAIECDAAAEYSWFN